jgi:hypothetical protein
MDRVACLEQVIMELNRHLIRVSNSFWQTIKLESDKMAELAKDADEDEILPVPEILKPEDNKHREPIAGL